MSRRRVYVRSKGEWYSHLHSALKLKSKIVLMLLIITLVIIPSQAMGMFDESDIWSFVEQVTVQLGFETRVNHTNC